MKIVDEKKQMREAALDEAKTVPVGWSQKLRVPSLQHRTFNNDSVLIKLQPFSPKICAVFDSDEVIFNSFSSTLKEQTTVQQNFCERESEGGGEENE